MRLVEEWFGTEVGRDLDVTRRIDAHLRSNPSEEAMFSREVPKLPEDLVNQYMHELPDEFVAMLRIYDGHVSGGLPFDYCDVVANSTVVSSGARTGSDLRQMIFKRLLAMGFSHNRWHVQGVAMSLLQGEADPSTVAMAADEIRAHPRAGLWLAGIADSYTLPKPIRQAFDDAAGAVAA